jgi:hypothetical protein
MQAAIRIRRAEEDDALALSVLADRTFRDAIADSNTTANMQLHCAGSYGQALQLAEIRDSSRETWVAESASRLVAYVQLRLDAVSPMISGERPAPRRYGSECGNETQEPWLSIENGGLTSWPSAPSSSATIPSVT